MINWKIKKKVILNKIKHVIVENELNDISEKVKAISTKRLKKDLINKHSIYSILNGAKYFYSGILQKYFVFILAKKYIKYFSVTTDIYLWKSNEMSEEIIEIINKTDPIFLPTLVYYPLPYIKINAYCLINNTISIPKKSNESIYLLNTRSMAKWFKHRICIR